MIRFGQIFAVVTAGTVFLTVGVYFFMMTVSAQNKRQFFSGLCGLIVAMTVMLYLIEWSVAK